MYKNKYSSTGNKNVFFTTLADATNRYDPVSDETYKVSAQVYADSINEWLEKPMTKEHDSFYADNKAPIKGEILDSFMNTEGYVDQNGVEHEATYLPTVCCSYNDSDFEKRKGVSNTFEIIDSEIEERDAGMEKVRIVKKIRPISLAVLFNQEPAFRACDVVNNSDNSVMQKIISIPIDKKLDFKKNSQTLSAVKSVFMENIEEKLRQIEEKIDIVISSKQSSTSNKISDRVYENANDLGISDADREKIRAEITKIINAYKEEMNKAMQAYKADLEKIKADIASIRKNNKANSDETDEDKSKATDNDDDKDGEETNNNDGDEDDKKGDSKKDNNKCGKANNDGDKGDEKDDKKDDKKDNDDDEDDEKDKKENSYTKNKRECNYYTRFYLQEGGSF